MNRISVLHRPRRIFARLAALASVLVVLVASLAAETFGTVPALRVARAGQVPVHASLALDGPDVSGRLPQLGPPPVTLTTIVSPGQRVVVPILMYHYVLPVSPTGSNALLFNLATAPHLFAQQMAVLHLEGATPISMATLIQALAGRGQLPPHPVVLTFDDGYVSFATAAEPVLQKYGFVGTDYVVSGFVGRPGYMNAAQVRGMDALGMVIGSHTVHHVPLASLPPLVAQAEIDGGKAALEQLLGHPVLDFAYPYGSFDPAVELLVRQAGFRDAVTTVGGDEQTSAGVFELHRTHVGGALSLAQFAAMAGLPAPSAAVLAWVARLAPDSGSSGGAARRGALAG